MVSFECLIFKSSISFSKLVILSHSSCCDVAVFIVTGCDANGRFDRLKLNGFAFNADFLTLNLVHSSGIFSYFMSFSPLKSFKL